MLPSGTLRKSSQPLLEIFAHNARKNGKGKKGKPAEQEMSGDDFFSKFSSAKKPEGKKHVSRTTAKTTVYKQQKPWLSIAEGQGIFV